MIFAAFNWYGMLIASGILTAGCLAYFAAKRRSINPEIVLDAILLGVPMAIIGARLYYIAFESGGMAFKDWFDFSDGGLRGLAIYGGVIGAIISGPLLVYGFYRKREPKNKITLLGLLDLAFSVFLIAQAIGRWGNFANEEVYGRLLENQSGFWAHFPFAVNVRGSYYYAMFFYESMLNLLGFGIIYYIYNNKKLRSFDGFIFALYMIWYGIVRAILENFRDHSYILWLIEDKLPVSVFVSILAVLLGIGIIAQHIIRARQQGRKVLIFVPQEQLSLQYLDYEKSTLYMIQKDKKAKKANSSQDAKQKQGEQDEERQLKQAKTREAQSEFDDEL